MRTRRGGREREDAEEEIARVGFSRVVIPRWLNVRGGFELCRDRSWTYEGRDRCCTAIRLTRLFWDNGYYLIAEYRAISRCDSPTGPSRPRIDSRTKCIPLRATVPNGLRVSRTSLSREHRRRFVLESYLPKLTKRRRLRTTLVRALTLTEWQR